MEKKSLSKEELIEQLNAVNPEDVEEYTEPSAMCYCPAPQPIEEKCDKCGYSKKIERWEALSDRENIKILKNVGDKVVVEHVCAKCAKQLGVTEPLEEGKFYYVYKANDQLFCFDADRYYYLGDDHWD